ncbi:MAG: 4-phosphoerythronate dehydrogenase [Thioalkalispiraceae bacterium]|jgi:erythronate-4-phosphate dehydrogenase
MKIFADQNIPFVTEAFSSLSSGEGEDEVILFDGRQVSASDISEADILLVRSVTKVNETLLAGSKVQFVASATIGTDHIDFDYLQSHNIPFANAPGCNAVSAAEYTLSGILLYAKEKDIPLSELNVAVVGYGNVGSRVTKRLDAIGINTFVFDPPRQLLNQDIEYISWGRVLECDVVTAHVPLTVDVEYPTKLMFDRAFFAALQAGSLFINTSRGGTQDESALLEQLGQKDLTLILDVWQNEPFINIELEKQTRISTPHIAGYSFDGKCRGTYMIYQAACQFLGEPERWSPQAVLEADQDSILEFDPESDHSLWNLVNQVYSIEADSARLRAGMKLDEQQRALLFDQLRKNYPKRREFSHYKVSQAGLSLKQQQMLSQLDFILI